MIITIDGPAASGKSTLSRMLAEHLDFYYLSSGLLYRALSYILVTHCNYTIETIADPSLEDIEYCFNLTRFKYCYSKEKKEHIFFNNEDITPFLKEKKIDTLASIISVNPHIRYAVTKLQRDIGSRTNIVIEGRDVGSFVFPHANIKFFITASLEIRARRWQKDQEKYNNHFSLDEAIHIINDRDERDKKRTIAPLVIPENAIIIDTSHLTITESVEKMVTIAKMHKKKDKTIKSSLLSLLLLIATTNNAMKRDRLVVIHNTHHKSATIEYTAKYGNNLIHFQEIIPARKKIILYTCSRIYVKNQKQKPYISIIPTY